MAHRHMLSPQAWTDLGAVPLAVQNASMGSCLLDYATPNGEGHYPGDLDAPGLRLRPGQIETCGPLGNADARHVFARAAGTGAIVVVIPGEGV